MGNCSASGSQQLQLSIREGHPVRHDCALSQQASLLIYSAVPAIYLQTWQLLCAEVPTMQCSNQAIITCGYQAFFVKKTATQSSILHPAPLKALLERLRALFSWRESGRHRVVLTDTLPGYVLSAAV